MKPVFVSFFTPPYAEHAAGLIASLDAFGLEHDVRAETGGGSWLANVNRKAGFILDMMAAHPGRPLVWLDADARVRQPPALFEVLDCDFAAHWRHGEELLSGTMLWGGTPAARQLCEVWQQRCAVRPDQWDQVTLDQVIDAGTVRGLRVAYLPATYTAIFDGKMCEGREVVILHLQASRQLKNAV